MRIYACWTIIILHGLCGDFLIAKESCLVLQYKFGLSHIILSCGLSDIFRFRRRKQQGSGTNAVELHRTEIHGNRLESQRAKEDINIYNNNDDVIPNITDGGLYANIVEHKSQKEDDSNVFIYATSDQKDRCQSYAYANHDVTTEPLAEDDYAYATSDSFLATKDTVISDEIDKVPIEVKEVGEEEGWKENEIYASENDVEGWKDNTIYVETKCILISLGIIEIFHMHSNLKQVEQARRDKSRP